MQQNRNIQDQVSSHIKTIKTKFESENRAKNLVLFGLKEEDASLNVVDNVKKLLDDVNFNYTPNKNQAFRLGAKKSEKPRPIKVCLNTKADKWELLKRLNAQKPL